MLFLFAFSLLLSSRFPPLTLHLRRSPFISLIPLCWLWGFLPLPFVFISLSETNFLGVGPPYHTFQRFCVCLFFLGTSVPHQPIKLSGVLFFPPLFKLHSLRSCLYISARPRLLYTCHTTLDLSPQLSALSPSLPFFFLVDSYSWKEVRYKSGKGRGLTKGKSERSARMKAPVAFRFSLLNFLFFLGRLRTHELRETHTCARTARLCFTYFWLSLGKRKGKRNGRKRRL